MFNQRAYGEHEILSREDIERLIELEIEERVSNLHDELRQRATYEEDEDFEKDSNSNLPRLEVVK